MRADDPFAGLDSIECSGSRTAVLRTHGAGAAVALLASALDVRVAVPDKTRLRGIDAAQTLVGKPGQPDQ